MTTLKSLINEAEPTPPDSEPSIQEIQNVVDQIIDIFNTIKLRCPEVEKSPQDKQELMEFLGEIGSIMHRYGILK